MACAWTWLKEYFTKKAMTAPPTESLRCDLLLFVAVEAEEEALKQVSLEFGIEPRLYDGRFGSYFDLGWLGTNRVFAMRSDMGAFSHRGSAAQAINCMAETLATGIIGVGMAFGIDPQEQSIGDVLISRGIIPYDNRDVSHYYDGSPQILWKNIKSYAAKPSLIELFRSASDNKQYQGKVKIGYMLSGGSRIHCKSYRDQLVRGCGARHADIIGGDMEGVGFLSSSDPQNPNWILVKGISDFADENRDKAIRSDRVTASRNALRFVLSALKGQKEPHVGS